MTSGVIGVEIWALGRVLGVGGGGLLALGALDGLDDLFGGVGVGEPDGVWIAWFVDG